MLRTPEQYIAELEEPRRAEIQLLHDLIREAAPELVAEAARIGPPS